MIDESHHSVVSIRKQSSVFTLRDESGNTVWARNVVICLGSLTVGAFPAFADKPGFISHYTQFDPSSAEPQFTPGNGPTAIDAFRYTYD